MQEPEVDPATVLTAPLKWPWAIAAPPYASSEQAGWQGALLRCWSGTSPLMVQPPLDHHYAVMHLGGAKRVTRRRDGPALSTIAENGSITLVPAGTSYVWRTEGPIAFAHLYLKPEHLESLIERELEIEGRGASLVESVGCRDPELELAFARMIEEIRAGATPSRLLLDSLLESFSIRLARRHASVAARPDARVVALAPYRLRRVIDFIDAHLGSDIGLRDLAEAAGTSQFHFGRAFRVATGCSPYRYLLRRRIERARLLLLAGDDSLATVGAACGFNSQHQFSIMFKRAVGVGPKRFRMTHRAAGAG